MRRGRNFEIIRARGMGLGGGEGDDDVVCLRCGVRVMLMGIFYFE